MAPKTRLRKRKHEEEEEKKKEDEPAKRQKTQDEARIEELEAQLQDLHALQRYNTLAQCDELVKLDNRHALAHAWRGKALYCEDRFIEAETAFTRSIELGHNTSDVFLSRARARRHLNNSNGLQSDLARAAEINPLETQVVGEQVKCLIDADRHDEAMVMVHKLIAQEPNHGMWYCLIASIHLKLDNNDEVVAVCDRILKNDFEDTTTHDIALAHIRRGLALRAQRKFEPALADMRAGNLARYFVPRAVSVHNDIIAELAEIVDKAKAEKEGRFNKECLVCMVAERTLAFLPCGHFACCKPCATKCLEGTKRECPVCKSRVESTNRIFMN